jgi:hypothetical protein
MMKIPSLKRRQQIAQEARAFHEAWQLAQVHAKAGNPDMAARIINSVKFSKSPRSERAWVMHCAIKRLRELQARNYERRMQGLPPFEPKPPPIH